MSGINRRHLTVNTSLSYRSTLFLLMLPIAMLSGQNLTVRGQASGWLSHAASATYGGLRYLPELSIDQQITETFSGTFEAAANLSASSRFSNGRFPLYTSALKPYRLWGRLAADQFELRMGLQKINFGPAVMFRSLMWFDAVDPRDPLQLTDGVYALLGRYYFQDNSMLWLWGLYGNNERKGLEPVPSEPHSVEYGGRTQIPLGNGEIGASYHHRRADLRLITTIPSAAVEHRYALDGKWDAEVGLWFELVVINRITDIHPFHFQRMLTLGADYTIGVGNGLTILAEHFRTEHPRTSPTVFRDAEFSAVSFSYPLSVMDRSSAMIYYDRKNNEWYRLISVQRTYDDWVVYLLGFWNPYGTSAAAGTNAFAGSGAQVMLVYNH